MKLISYCEQKIVKKVEFEMKISTEINSTAKILGEERAVEALAKAGFDAWDFSMFSMCNYDWKHNDILENSHPLAGADYLKFARKLKKIGLDNGIVCNQSHAPFPSRCKAIRDFYKRAIECTAEAGGKICVIHPDNDKSPEENAQMYFEILSFAKEHGVKIATENMWNWDNEKNHSSFAACATPESFNAHLKAVNDDFFVACLDIGHAEMKGSDTNAVEMILALGDKLQALHIHDNDGADDQHLLPYQGTADWESFVKALAEIDYSGVVMLETPGSVTEHMTEDARLLAESETVSVAGNLAKAIEKERRKNKHGSKNAL